MRHEMTHSWQATWEDIPASKGQPVALSCHWFSVLYTEMLNSPWVTFLKLAQSCYSSF